MAQVVSVILQRRFIELDDGRFLPITAMVNAMGDPTENLDNAVAFICDDGERTYSVMRDHETEVTVH